MIAFNPAAMHLYRQRLRLSLRNIASKTGMTLDMAWRIENGHRVPTPEHLTALAAALEVTEASLLQKSEASARQAARGQYLPVDAILPRTRAGFSPVSHTASATSSGERATHPLIVSVYPAWIEQTEAGPRLIRIFSRDDIDRFSTIPVDEDVDTSSTTDRYTRQRQG